MQLVAHGRGLGESSRVALEHALLVSLSERPAAGIELTRRFDRSIGFFWSATHQQIYKVLRRMEADGWVVASAGDARSTERRWRGAEGGVGPAPGAPRSPERRYTVPPAGEQVLAEWIGSPTAPAVLRS